MHLALRLELYPFKCQVHVIEHTDDCSLQIIQGLFGAFVLGVSICLLQFRERVLEPAAA